MKLIHYAMVAILLTLLVILLIATKGLMIPFVISLFLFVILRNSTDGIAQKVPSIVTNLKARSFIGFGISLALLIGFLTIIYVVINFSINSIVYEFPKYEHILQTKISVTQNKLDLFTHQNEISQLMIGQGSAIMNFLAKIRINEVIANTVSAIPYEKVIAESSAILTNMAKDGAMILVYLMFLSLEYKHLISKLAKTSRENPRKMKKITEILRRINSDFITYIRVKFIASFFTGLLSYGVLVLFDVDFAPFWGFMLFLLNFIPTIGSIVAVAMPVILSMVQFDSLGMVFGLASVLTAIQFLIGNFLEPRYQGKVLNLSPLVILISLGIWGKIWGIIGMFLSVPIMVGINIVLSQFQSTRKFAEFLSASGELPDLINDYDEEIDRKEIEASIQI